jgi:hypothetical protein
MPPQATRVRYANEVSRNLRQTQSREVLLDTVATKTRNESPLLIVPSGNVMGTPSQGQRHREIIRVSPESGFQNTRNAIDYGMSR